MIHYNRALAQVKPGTTLLDKAAYQQKQQEVLRDLIQADVFQRQSELFGIRVPDTQVVNSIASIPQFHNDKGAFDPQLYMRFPQAIRRTPWPLILKKNSAIRSPFLSCATLINSCVKITDDEMRRAYAERGAAFLKTNAYDVSADGKKKRLRTQDELTALFRQQLLEEKSLYALNQWFNQIGQKLRVKPYLDRLQLGGN